MKYRSQYSINNTGFVNADKEKHKDRFIFTHTFEELVYIIGFGI